MTDDGKRGNVIIVRSRATDHTVDKFAKSLSHDGYSVELLLWNRQKTPIEEKGEGYVRKLLRLEAPQDRGQAVLFFPVWWIYEFFFLLRRNPDVVHAYDLDTLLPAICIKLLKKTRLFYSIGDFYANNLPEGFPRAVRNMIREFVGQVEKTLASFADTVFLVDETRREELGWARTGNVQIIYNSPPDYSHVEKGKANGVRNQLTVFYAGVISRQRGLLDMIKAVRNVNNVRLVVGGTGPDAKCIQETARGGKNVEYLGWLPSYEDVIRMTQEADVLFRFSNPKIPKTRYESPNKLFEAMMCAKPIIVSDGSSMADIVRKEECGIVVPYGDVNAIEGALRQLMENKKLRESLGRNGRHAYERRYSWTTMEGRLLKAYHDATA
jgi:glycosyltransferase involved in cell wall biosynthesis